VAGVREESFAGDLSSAMKRDGISLAMIARGGMYLLSLNLLVFLRRQFGERMTGDLCVACGFSWCCSWLYGVLRVWLLPQLPEARLTAFFVYGLSGLTAYHIACTWLRRKKAATIHSYSRGRPMGVWRIFRAEDEIVARYFQPSACALVAISLARWDKALGWWIGAASVAVFVEEQVGRVQMRRRVLDTIDGRIESQALYGQVQERIAPVSAKASQTAIVEMAEPPMHTAGGLGNIVARLDPELQKMLEPAEAAKPEKEK